MHFLVLLWALAVLALLSAAAVRENVENMLQ